MEYANFSIWETISLIPLSGFFLGASDSPTSIILFIFLISNIKYESEYTCPDKQTNK